MKLLIFLTFVATILFLSDVSTEPAKKAPETTTAKPIPIFSTEPPEPSTTKRPINEATEKLIAKIGAEISTWAHENLSVLKNSAGKGNNTEGTGLEEAEEDVMEVQELLDDIIREMYDIYNESE